VAELIWLLNGHEDSAFLNYWNSRLPKFAGPGPVYRGAYGNRLRKHFGLDQIERAVKVLAHNPDTRQVVLQIWDGTIDLPDDSGTPSNTDIPCNLISILKVRDGRLEWLQVLRSNDLFLGLPYNFLQFTTLQEVLAGWLGVQVGTYNHVSDSLHIYARDMGQIIQSREESPAPNTDSLLLPLEESQQALEELDEAARFLTRDTATEAALRRRVSAFGGPQAYRNWLTLLAAETARKRTWHPLAGEFASQLTNPALLQQWSLWIERVNSHLSASSSRPRASN
jgi:thymidylate synthase